MCTDASLISFRFLQYNETEKIAIGTYHFNMTDDSKWNVTLCNTHYIHGEIFAYNSTYYYDKSVKKSTCTLRNRFKAARLKG